MNCDFDGVEVVAVINGETQKSDCAASEAHRADFAPGGYPFKLITDRINRANISAAKNRAVDLSSGELLLFINDDTLVERDFVSAHMAAHAGLEQPAMVLGHTAWRRFEDETVLDRLIAETSMVFFYHRMTTHSWYGFRHAWNLNLSVPRRYAFEERFDERFHYSFEDMEWAFRLETGHGLRVWYEPAAASLHDHRYTLDGYLKRERQHGQVAARSWDVNSDCFRAVYGRYLDRSLINYYRAYIENEGRSEAEALERFHRVAGQPASTLPRDEQQQSDMIHTLYYAHLPLKRLAFRRGFIEALQTGRRPDSFEAVFAEGGDLAHEADAVSAVTRGST